MLGAQVHCPTRRIQQLRHSLLRQTSSLDSAFGSQVRLYLTSKHAASMVSDCFPSAAIDLAARLLYEFSPSFRVHGPSKLGRVSIGSGGKQAIQPCELGVPRYLKSDGSQKVDRLTELDFRRCRTSESPSDDCLVRFWGPSGTDSLFVTGLIRAAPFQYIHLLLQIMDLLRRSAGHSCLSFVPCPTGSRWALNRRPLSLLHPQTRTNLSSAFASSSSPASKRSFIY